MSNVLTPSLLSDIDLSSLEQSEEKWEEPIPFDTYPVEEFPQGCLPKALEDMAKATALSTQTPLCMDYAAVLATAAIPVQGKYNVQISSDYNEPLNIYVAAVAESGERKSAVFKMLTQPLKEYELLRNKKLAPYVMQSDAEYDILDKRRKLIKNEAIKTGDTSDLKKICNEIANFKKINFERYICDDTTPEALTSLMAENNGRIGLISAEGGVLGYIKGRYNGSSGIDIYLKGHAGDMMKVDRKTRQSESILNPCLTILITIQPRLLKDIISDDEYRDRGLDARFLYAIVDDETSIVGRRPATSPPIPMEIKTAYNDAFVKLLEYRSNETQNLFLSADAEQLRKSFFELIEPRLNDELHFMRDWAAKLPGAVCRIAGILHCYSCDKPVELPINGETMKNAIKLGLAFLQHAQAAYGTMGGNKNAASAKYVLKKLAGVTDITKRNLHQLCRGRFKKIDDLEPIIKLLIEHGYLKESIVFSEGAGRKPSPKYLVNPMM